MTPDNAFKRYLDLCQSRPEWFRTNADDAFHLVIGADEVKNAEDLQAQRLRKAGKDFDSHVGVVYEDPYILVLRDAVRRPDGSLGTYVRVMHQGRNGAGVVVLPVCGGQIVLFEHFRHASRSWFLECPRGFAEDLSFQETARKELLEELGASLLRLEPLGTLYPDSGMMGSPCQLYFAEIGSIGTPEKAEGIRNVQSIPPAQVRGMIANGAIVDAFTIAAFARAAFKGLI